MMAEVSLLQQPSYECHWTLLMINQHDGWGISEIALWLMSLDPTDDKLTLAQRTAWCRQAKAITCAVVEPELSRHTASLVRKQLLTINMQRPSFLGLTRSISWLLMPWLLASPGHQQPWYWLCKLGKSLSYTRKDFNYLWHTCVGEGHKM